MMNNPTRLSTLAVSFSLALAVGACAHDESSELRSPDHHDLSGNVDGIVNSNGDHGTACPKVPHPADPSKLYDVPVGDSPTRGPDTAKVTIVVACDFECGYCRRVQPTLQRVRETYGNSVRLVFKHNPIPFHKDAMNAALASEAAHKQDEFWPMHDLLLNHQEQLGAERYLEFAQQLGLDLSRFETDMKSPALRQRVEADRRLVRSIGGQGTPSFWVNGRFFNGAQPFSSFRSVIFNLLADREVPPGALLPAVTKKPGDKDCGCGAK